MNNNTNIVIIIFFLALFLGFHAVASESAVVIKVRAINPLEEEAPVTIHYPLPAGLTPEDVLAKRVARGKGPAIPADFEINFDEDEKIYFVDHQITLASREIVVLEVEAKDIWVVPQKTIDGFKRQVEELLQSQPPAPEGEPGPDPVALKLKEEIFRQLEEIVEDQKATAITQVGVQGHIEAYQKNRETLQQVGMDITMLRNMVAADARPAGSPLEGAYGPREEARQTQENPRGETGARDQAAPSGTQNASGGPAEQKQSVADKLKSLFKWK